LLRKQTDFESICSSQNLHDCSYQVRNENVHRRPVIYSFSSNHETKIY